MKVRNEKEEGRRTGGRRGQKGANARRNDKVRRRIGSRSMSEKEGRGRMAHILTLGLSRGKRWI